MKHIHFFQILSQIFPFIRAQNTERKTNQGPQMDGVPFVIVNLTEIMHLGVTVVARGDAVIRLGIQNLLRFKFTVFAPLFGKTGLQKTTPAAAAVIVGTVGLHVDKILFADDSFDDVA